MDRFSQSTSGVLTGQQIRELILGEEPLIAGWSDLDAQIQPNGFDLTLDEVAVHIGSAFLPRDNDGRELPELEPLLPAGREIYDLAAGIYHITYRETVRLPAAVMALGRPRSSLNRGGVTIHSAVWDAGYHGRSTSLLAVLNPAGFRVERGARVLQLVFFSLAAPAERLYQGRYQGENLPRGEE